MASHQNIQLKKVVVKAQTESPISKEEFVKKLREAIKEKNEDSFHRHLSWLDELLQDDIRMKDLLNGSLTYAAYIGFQPAVETLIQKDADVNAMSAVSEDPEDPDWKGSPLHWAARGGHVDTVIFFLEQGIDVNIKNENRKTPLHWAAGRGHVDTVRCLIDKGADTNIKDSIGYTPLHFAASGGHVGTVRHLVEHGTDTNVKDNFGKTPLHVAAEGGQVDTVRYLADQAADINIKDSWSGYTPLHSAAGRGHGDTVRCLVDKGADTNIKDKNGATPLHLAACRGHVYAVRCLADKGADTYTKDARGYTPLHWAAWGNHVDTVRCLVAKGAGTNIKGNDDKTPLHIAAGRGHVDNVRCLVDKGADTNIKDKNGATSLHSACAGGDVETVKCLLEKGADSTAKDKDGQTSLSWAISSRHKDVAAFLMEQENWVGMLRSADRESTTPMGGLIAFMPDVAEMVFSRCVKTNKGKGQSWDEEVHADSRNLEVEFNYEFLEDFQNKQPSDNQFSREEGPAKKDTSAKFWQPKKFTKHSHPLFLIKKHHRSNLMKHPLVISLLDYKWKKFGRRIFFGNLFIYLIFLVFLTAFGLVVLSPVERPCTEVLNGSFNETVQADCGDLTTDEYRFVFVGAVFTIATALLRLAIELTQLCRHPLEYLQDWVNWLEIPLYLCSMIFTFVFATPCLCIYNWQWQIGVVSVFLSWIGLISFLQKWPVTGVYILMFINIIQSFLKIAFLALLLVIAFALAFYMLFFEPDEMRNAFSNPGRAIVKVMTMTTGELDYDAIFHQQEGEEEIAFLPVSFVLWVIFLVLIPVLLNNLLVGLAVGDVESRLKTAFENRIELQIDLVLTCQELLESQPIKKLFDVLHIYHWHAIQTSATLYPNVPETLLPKWCKGGKNDWELVSPSEGKKKSDRARSWIAKRYAHWWISDDYSTSGVNVCNKINPAQDPTEKQLEHQSDQLGELQQQGKELEAKLQQLSEEQAQKLDKQSKEMKEQTAQLAGEMATLKEKVETKLQQDFQEAIKQLSEKSEEQVAEMREQTKEMREQAKKMEEQTAQLAGEVVTLREALQKLLTKMDV